MKRVKWFLKKILEPEPIPRDKYLKYISPFIGVIELFLGVFLVYGVIAWWDLSNNSIAVFLFNYIVVAISGAFIADSLIRSRIAKILALITLCSGLSYGAIWAFQQGKIVLSFDWVGFGLNFVIIVCCVFMVVLIIKEYNKKRLVKGK
jgi:large-conductance mechanosensitive channel